MEQLMIDLLDTVDKLVSDGYQKNNYREWSKQRIYNLHRVPYDQNAESD